MLESNEIFPIIQAIEEWLVQEKFNVRPGYPNSGINAYTGNGVWWRLSIDYSIGGFANWIDIWFANAKNIRNQHTLEELDIPPHSTGWLAEVFSHMFHYEGSKRAIFLHDPDFLGKLRKTLDELIGEARVRAEG